MHYKSFSAAWLFALTSLMCVEIAVWEAHVPQNFAHGNNLAPDEGVRIFSCTMTDHARKLGKI
jgi:hypothetical protein